MISLYRKISSLPSLEWVVQGNPLWLLKLFIKRDNTGILNRFPAILGSFSTLEIDQRLTTVADFLLRLQLSRTKEVEIQDLPWERLQKLMTISGCYLQSLVIPTVITAVRRLSRRPLIRSWIRSKRTTKGRKSIFWKKAESSQKSQNYWNLSKIINKK